ncbi:MAG TPA: head GIN domain-containing protein, partial [Phnomibacter sp.]|nr:head GIN domain-containing protein [Phnomibacter sp.]
MKNTAAAWLMGIALMASTALSAQWKKIKGEGQPVKEARTVSAFQAVKLSGGMKVLITKGSHQVQVEAEPNLMPYIETEVSGSTLQVRTKQGYSIGSRGIVIHVSMPTITAASIAGSGQIESVGTLDGASQFDANISGSGDIKMAITTGKTKATINGSGDILLQGNTQDVEVRISGSGSYKGFALKATDAKVQISGSGNAETAADG